MVLSFAVVLAMGVAALAHPADEGSQGAPTIRFQARFKVSDAPAAPLDAYQSYQKVPPGSWTPTHVHAGPEMGLVIIGEAARWDRGRVRIYKPGDTFFDPAGQVHAAGNKGTVDSYHVAFHLLPRGADYSSARVVDDAPRAEPGAGALSNVCRSKFALDTLPAFPFTVVESVLDFAPGASTQEHAHGLILTTVLEGELNVVQDGNNKKYQVGDNWMEQRGDTVVLSNLGATPASCMMGR